MPPITQAQLDEEVTLSAVVQGGAEGKPVQFRVVDDDGATLATLPSTVKQGEAKAVWRVDVPPERLPLDVTSIAEMDGQSVKSGRLRIVAGATRSTAGLLASPGGAAPTPSKPAASTFALTSDGDGAGGGGADEDIEELPANAIGGPEALWSHLFLEGEVLRIRLNVTVLGHLAKWNYHIDAELQQQSGTTWKTIHTITRDRTPPSGGEAEVLLKWTVRTTHVDRSQPPPYRLRFRLTVRQVIVAFKETKETPPIDVLPSLVEVTLGEPLTASDLGSEASRDLRDNEVRLEPAGAASPAAPVGGTTHTGVVTLMATAGDANLRVLRHGPHTEPIVWQIEDGSQRPAPSLPLKIETGDTIKKSVRMHGRLRNSIWCDPAKFFGVGKVRTATIDRAPAEPVLDDITLLNVFEVTGAFEDADIERRSETKIKNAQGEMVPAAEYRIRDPWPIKSAGIRLRDDFNSAWSHNVVNLCHSKGIQAIGNLDAVLNHDNHNFRRVCSLVSLGTDKQIDDFALAVATVVREAGYDGFDIDLEDGLVNHWLPSAFVGFRRLARALGRALAADNRLLALTNGPWIGRSAKGTPMAADFLPAEGTNELQPYDLALEAPNVILRPMLYDNGVFNDNDKLFRMHAQTLDYAMRRRPDAPSGSPEATKPSDGAGLHPGQFQAGVKIFLPEGGGKGGVITSVDSELPRACREVYRLRRAGVIQFSYGGQQDQFGIDLFWKRMTNIDRALNGGPPPTVAKGKPDWVIPGATVGQPLQVPLSQAQRDAMFKPFTPEKTPPTPVEIKTMVNDASDELVVLDGKTEVARLPASGAEDLGKSTRVFHVDQLDDDKSYRLELRSKSGQKRVAWILQPGLLRESMATHDKDGMAKALRVEH